MFVIIYIYIYINYIMFVDNVCILISIYFSRNIFKKLQKY